MNQWTIIWSNVVYLCIWPSAKHITHGQMFKMVTFDHSVCERIKWNLIWSNIAYLHICKLPYLLYVIKCYKFSYLANINRKGINELLFGQIWCICQVLNILHMVKCLKWSHLTTLCVKELNEILSGQILHIYIFVNYHTYYTWPNVEGKKNYVNLLWSNMANL